jgi:hypothetical protein
MGLDVTRLEVLCREVLRLDTCGRSKMRRRREVRRGCVESRRREVSRRRGKVRSRR